MTNAPHASPAVSSAKALQDQILAQSQALVEGENDPVTNAANLAALCWMEMPDISWVGVYFLHGDELVLGPFQGKPACTRIAMGAGVCGTAAATRQTQLVADVHAFPGHIACDAASASEIVVPILDGDRLLGVWDIDSARMSRFTEDDATLVAALMRIYVDSLKQTTRRAAHG